MENPIYDYIMKTFDFTARNGYTSSFPRPATREAYILTLKTLPLLTCDITCDATRVYYRVKSERNKTLYSQVFSDSTVKQSPHQWCPRIRDSRVEALTFVQYIYAHPPVTVRIPEMEPLYPLKPDLSPLTHMTKLVLEVFQKHELQSDPFTGNTFQDLKFWIGTTLERAKLCETLDLNVVKEEVMELIHGYPELESAARIVVQQNVHIRNVNIAIVKRNQARHDEAAAINAKCNEVHAVIMKFFRDTIDRYRYIPTMKDEQLF